MNPIWGSRVEDRHAQLGRAEWGEWRFEPEELIFIGSDHLLTVGRMKGTGLTSGANVDTDWSSLFTIHDGRTIREQIFLDRGEAMAAVGLTRVMDAVKARHAGFAAELWLNTGLTPEAGSAR